MSGIRLFCSDLDGTLLGSPESGGRLRTAWDSMQPERRPMLCYNSGRLIDDMLSVIRSSGLPEPDFILGGVGTQAYDVPRGEPLLAFTERFAEGWDLELVERTLEREFPGAQPQPAEFLHRYKSSWFLQAAPQATLTAIEARLRGVGVDVAIVYSSQRYLDVLPRNANKGNALVWLAQHLGLPHGSILVASDSGNDSSMFRIPGVRGILVENARRELIKATSRANTYAATGILAEGVLDGLRHFRLLEAWP